MARLRQTPDGDFIRERRTGKWRPASADESALGEASALGLAAEATGKNILQGLDFLVAATGGGLIGAPDIARTQEAQERLSERGARLAAIESIRPVPGLIGLEASLVLDPLNLLIPPAGKAIARGAQSQVDNVFAGGARVGKTQAREPPPAGIAATGDAVEAATRRAEQTQAAKPPAAKATNKIRDAFDSMFGEDKLTTQQQALIPTAEKLGFRFFPGQRESNLMFFETLLSHPVARQALEPELLANARRMEQLLMVAMDVPQATTKRFPGIGFLGETRDVVGKRFESVRGGLDDLDAQLIMDPDDIALLNEPGMRALSTSQRSQIDLTNMTSKQALEVRSRLNRRASDFYANAETTAGDDLVKVIETLDGQIEEALSAGGKGELMETWRKARAQWRVRLALKKPGVFTSEGNLSIKSLERNLGKMFEREFGEALIVTDDFRKLNPEIADLLDFARVARTFASNMPDSGTATRQFASRLFAHPLQTTAEIAAAKSARMLLEQSAKAAARRKRITGT